jgi:hypothetical protein
MVDGGSWALEAFFTKHSTTSVAKTLDADAFWLDTKACEIQQLK